MQAFIDDEDLQAAYERLANAQAEVDHNSAKMELAQQRVTLQHKLLATFQKSLERIVENITRLTADRAHISTDAVEAKRRLDNAEETLKIAQQNFAESTAQVQQAEQHLATATTELEKLSCTSRGYDLCIRF